MLLSSAPAEVTQPRHQAWPSERGRGSFKQLQARRHGLTANAHAERCASPGLSGRHGSADHRAVVGAVAGGVSLIAQSRIQSRLSKGPLLLAPSSLDARRRRGKGQGHEAYAVSDDVSPATAGNASDAESKAYQEIDKSYASIALPSFMQLLVEPLAGSVDTAYIGHLSRAALGGLGVAANAQYSLTKLFNDPLLRVTTSFVAAAPPSERRETVGAVIFLAALLGLSQVLLFGIGTGTVIRGMGVAPASGMFAPAVAYLRVRALGAPIASALLALTGVCRGLGDSRTPLYASIVATVVNVALDPVLIFGFGWGAAGAAVATVFAQACGTLVLARKLRREWSQWSDAASSESEDGSSGSERPQWRWSTLRIVMASFVSKAVIMIGRNWGKVLCFAFLGREAALQGIHVAAAYTLTFQLGFATSQVAESLSTSSQVLLAQALRAKKDDDGDSKSQAFPPLSRSQACRHIVWKGVQIGLLLSLVLSVCTRLAQGPILAALTSDVQVRQLVAMVMPSVLVAQVLKALAYPMNGALLGGLDWVFTALSMWVAGASGVAALCLCKRLGFVVTGGTGLAASVSGLHSIWLGFSMFFGMQVVLGALRIASRTGVWRALRHQAR